MKKGQYFTPSVTAFDKDGNIDAQANKNVWDHLIAGGVTGIVVMGSTGEFFFMSKEQKIELIKLAGSYLKGRTKLFIGTGNMRAEDTIELSNLAFDNGADGVMIVGPYYFPLPDDSIEAYFSKVAENVKGNIFLYNFPGCAGYDLKPAMALKLLKKHKNIIGYKDTVDAMAHTRSLIATIRGLEGRSDAEKDFVILSGKDENFAHTILSGGDGSIGGYSNLYPELAGAWIKAMDEKDMDKVSKIEKIMDRVNDFGPIGVFIPVLKKAMILRGVGLLPYCQFPFSPADDAQTAKIQALLDEIEPFVKAVV